MDFSECNYNIIQHFRTDSQHQLCVASKSKLLIRLFNPGNICYTRYHRMRGTTQPECNEYHIDWCYTKLVGGTRCNRLYAAIQNYISQHVEYYQYDDDLKTNQRYSGQYNLYLAGKGKLFGVFHFIHIHDNRCCRDKWLYCPHQPERNKHNLQFSYADLDRPI